MFNTTMTSTDVAILLVKQTMRRRFSPSSASYDRASVCRNLFGPVDHDETERMLDEENQRIREADAARYNFDFVRERPLSGRYQWESVVVANNCSSHSSPAVRPAAANATINSGATSEGWDGEGFSASKEEGPRNGRSDNALQCSRRPTLRELNEQTAAVTIHATDEHDSARSRQTAVVRSAAYALAEAARHLTVSGTTLAPLATTTASSIVGQQPPFTPSSRPHRQTVIPDYMRHRKRSAAESKSVSSSMATNGTPSKLPKTSP